MLHVARKEVGGVRNAHPLIRKLSYAGKCSHCRSFFLVSPAYIIHIASKYKISPIDKAGSFGFLYSLLRNKGAIHVAYLHDVLQVFPVITPVSLDLIKNGSPDSLSRILVARERRSDVPVNHIEADTIRIKTALKHRAKRSLLRRPLDNEQNHFLCSRHLKSRTLGYLR